MRSGEGSVYLYTHWAGCDLPLTVRDALAKRWRWDHEAYLARIIFDEMVGQQQGDETGFGIATYAPDNEHPIIHVDCNGQRVTYEPTEYVKDDRSWSFEEYVAAKPEDLAFRSSEET